MPLTKAQIITAKRQLKQAFDLTADARAILHKAGEDDAGLRLRNIGRAILTIIDDLDALLASPP